MTDTTLIDALTQCAEDPMWADHAEVRKSLLRAAVKALQVIPAQSVNRDAIEAAIMKYPYFTPHEAREIASAVSPQQDAIIDRLRRTADDLRSHSSNGDVDPGTETFAANIIDGILKEFASTGPLPPHDSAAKDGMARVEISSQSAGRCVFFIKRTQIGAILAAASRLEKDDTAPGNSQEANT